MLNRKVRIYIFGLVAVIFGVILIFDYQGSEVCAQCVTLPQLYKHVCDDGRKRHTDNHSEVWCGPTHPELKNDRCVPFVVYQNQNDNDKDELWIHGCLIENNRLFAAQDTSGGDDEDTAHNSTCGAICVDYPLIRD